ERGATGHPHSRSGSTQREMPAPTGRPQEFSNEPFFSPRDQRQAPAPTSSLRQAAPPPSAAQHPGADEILRDIARAAGISPDLLQSRDPYEVAAEIGAVLRTTVEQLALLLKARAAAKILAKST
ncbi:type VI secretion system-associated FHA domain protein TagH, partial [Mesorhizobium sp. M8A.F.Ca.ET.213.01.1.1]